MKQEFRFAGIGGQGIILLGTVLARAFALYENLHTVQTTFYSAAYRCGLTSTDIIVSDDELYDLTVDTPVYILLTAKKAFVANKGLLNTAQCILLDKRNITVDENLQSQDPSKLYLYDFYTIAKKHNLQPRSANMIMLGVVAKKSGIVSQDSLLRALCDVNKKDVDNNIKAITIGYSSI
jgi:2-oxoglutarate ferredoxin oxidoreductase subunit gamma